MYCLYNIFTGGWNGVDEYLMYANPKYNKKMAYEYFFIVYFLVANICLMNVVQSFFIDQICAATAYEEPEEEVEDEGADGGALEIDGEVEIEEDGEDRPVVEKKKGGGLFGGLGRGGGVEVELEMQPVGSVDALGDTLMDVDVEVDMPALEVEVEVG
jgi:hypothetical protein